MGGRSIATNYTPARHAVQDFKATVRLAWCEACNGQGPFTGPVAIRIVAVFPRPKSMMRKRGDNPTVPKTTKPDWDNVGKSVCDSLTGLAYHDDSQIFVATVEKFIAAGDEQPHVDITIWEVPDA
jgi:Holliday junction resolvase RusA-like endonuclease